MLSTNPTPQDIFLSWIFEEPLAIGAVFAFPMGKLP